jgi:pimeloyl-ACP methyl ester carboxylesterase
VPVAMALLAMPKTPKARPPAALARVRRGYFESRFGQLHLHNSMPPGGGFEEGTPVLCIQDLTGTGRAFAPFMALAGRDRSVYAPDLPGLGESDPPGLQATVADYAAALGDFLDTMRIRRLHVLGNRAGALIGAELALARPEQIAALVMVSVPLAAPGQRHPFPLEAPASDSQRMLAAALTQYAARERLARLIQKVLLVRPKDELWEASWGIREVLPSARVVDLEIPGGQLLADQPARLLEAVRDFLRV